MDTPKILWKPTPDEAAATNIGRAMAELGLTDYGEFHRWSVENREAFWERAIRSLGIHFSKPYERVLDLSEGVEQPRWCAGARFNIADSCFQAPSDQLAVVYQREGGPLEKMTYGELETLSNRVANGLVEAGFSRGDAIAVDMVMTVASVAIYLGIVKAGCSVVSIADSFAPEEIKTRLRIADARGIFTQDHSLRGGKKLPMYEKVMAADAPMAIVLPCENRVDMELRDGDMTWQQFLRPKVSFDSVPMEPDETANILFSSGTTGDPKAIPWTHLTPIKAAMDGHYHQDIRPGEVVAWPTNLGWVMGPWLIFASLINKGTMALYYGAPAGKEFGEFVRNAGVNMLGLVPSMVKNWRRTQCMEGMDWSSVKCFSSTGECSNADDYTFLMSLANNRPVIEYCGGTEIGGGYITGTLVQPASPSTFTTPTLGLDFVILDEAGKPAKEGELFLIPPSIGLSQRLLNRDHDEVYYQGTPPGPNGEQLRRHGDQMEVLPGGFYRGAGRADDTMNLGGIKTSSAEIERVLNLLDGVVETAAIGVEPRGGGPSQLVIYAVMNEARDGLQKEMQAAIKAHLNPLFRIADVVVTEKLPRTASNKVMRRVLRSQYKSG